MMTTPSVLSAACALAIASIELSTLTAAAADAMQASPPAVSPANSDSNTERVRTLFRDGNAQIVAGNYEGARASLLQAWALRQSSDIAGALGQVELATNRYRDAAEHLQWCLAHFPPVESEQVLQATRHLFEQAKWHVGQLRVSANLEGASILIDGKVVGTTPVTTPFFLDPGQHRVEARLNGVNDTRTIAADAGKDYGIDFSLDRTEPGAVGGATAGPSARGAEQDDQSEQRFDSTSSGRSIVPVMIGGAVFTVALGAGIALLDSSSSSYDDARVLQNQVGPAGCANPTRNQVQCAELKTASEKGDSRERWGAVALATAGVALVAVPIYWFWPREKDHTSRAQWRIRGSVAPQCSGLWFAGDF